jgi:DNA polymerase-1
MHLALVADPTKARGEFRRLVATYPAPLAIDLETYADRPSDALHPTRGDIRLLSIAPPSGEPALFDLRALSYNGLPWAELLSTRPLIVHNASFEAAWLAEKLNAHPKVWFDTYVAAKLLGNGDHPHNDLGSVLSTYLGLKLDKSAGISDWGAFFLVDAQIKYAANDVIHLHRLRETLEKRLDAEGLTRCFNLESQLLPIVAEMSRAGMPVDPDRLCHLDKDFTFELEGREAVLRQYLGDRVSLESPKQLLSALSALGVVLTDTAEETLVKEKHPAARALLSYRESLKRKQQAVTLVGAIGPGNLIKCSFVQMGAVSGRFSARAPNLQQIARGPLRSIFVAPLGERLIVLDYSQIELRIAAALAPDARMLEAFRAGEDLHRATGAMLLRKLPKEITRDERQIAKSAAFGLLYGAGAQGLRAYAQATYGIKLTLEAARDLRSKFFRHYGGLAAWHARAHEGETRVTEGRTVTGRRRFLYVSPGAEVSDINWNAFQLLTNFPVQGSAADVLKLAMIKVAESLQKGARLRACVHDELILSAPAGVAQETLARAHTAMTQAFNELFPGVPIEVEGKICTSWGEK